MNVNPNKVTKSDIKKMDARTKMYLINQIGALSNFDLNIWIRAYKNHPDIYKIILEEYNTRQIG